MTLRDLRGADKMKQQANKILKSLIYQCGQHGQNNYGKYGYMQAKYYEFRELLCKAQDNLKSYSDKDLEKLFKQAEKLGLKIK